MYLSATPTYMNVTILLTLLNIHINMAFHGITSAFQAFQPDAAQHA